MENEKQTKSNNNARLIKIEKSKRRLRFMAYTSLVADILIALVTLISLRFVGDLTVGEIITILNYALTVIVIISSVLFVDLLVISYYQKLVEKILRLRGGFKMQKKPKK